MTLPAPWAHVPAHAARAMVASEYKLHCQVAQVLEQHCFPTWRYSHLPFGELRAAATSGRLKAMGVQPGWPDFIFVGPGRTCFLELKRPGRKLSKDQAALATFLLQSGCGYGMTSEFDDAIGMLKSWGVLPDTVRP